jgi:MFS family permease
MITGMLLICAGLVTIPFISITGSYYVMMAVVGVGIALVLPSWMSLILEQLPTRNRATVLGGVGTITSFGLVVGPIAATALYESAGPVWPFFIAAAFIGANAIFIAYLFRDYHERHQRRKTEHRLPYYVEQ